MPSEFFDSEALTSSRPASVVPMVRLLLLLQSFTLCIVVVAAALVWRRAYCSSEALQNGATTSSIVKLT